MKKSRIYIDTSVIGGCFDEEFAIWSNGLVVDFKAGLFKPILSDIVAAEVNDAPDRVREKFKEILEESLRLDPDMPHTQFELGRLLKASGDPKGIELIKKAFDKWKDRFDKNKMTESDYSWLPSAADELGMHDFAHQVRQSKPQFKGEGMYNPDNLTKSYVEEGLIKR